VVVTRYFGGILLGTGGLTRAYSSGAAGALLAALPAIKTEASTWRFTVDYARFARIETVLSAFPSIRFDSITYTADVSVLVTIPRESEQRLQEELSALTDGQVTPKEYSRQFVMF